MSDKKAPEKREVAGGYGSPDSVEWGSVGVHPGKGEGQNKGDKKTLPYLKLEEGKPYRIRLVGKPIKFYSHFDVIRAISPGLEHDVCWQAGNVPRERYAILVLDRTDENKLKVLEAGPSVFNDFKTYFELTGGKDPGDKGGPDWLIQVKVPTIIKDGRAVKDKRSTKYNVMRDESAPFTSEEIAYMAKETNKDIEIVKKLKAPTSPDLIKEMFEDAKVRSDKDPVPGSPDWWKARREKKQAASGSAEEAPIVPPEAGESTDPKPEAKKETGGDGAQTAGFNGLFEEGGEAEDSGKESTGF